MNADVGILLIVGGVEVKGTGESVAEFKKE